MFRTSHGEIINKLARQSLMPCAQSFWITRWRTIQMAIKVTGRTDSLIVIAKIVNMTRAMLSTSNILPPLSCLSNQYAMMTNTKINAGRSVLGEEISAPNT